MKKHGHTDCDDRGQDSKGACATPVYIVSGGMGASGRQLVNTVLAQFPGATIPVVMVPHVSTQVQIEEALARAAKSGGTIVHTLVNVRLREAMNRLAKERGVPAVDLMGGLIGRLSSLLGMEPAGRPGMYRRLNRQYFERIEAIEYAIAHDDGQDIGELSRAEIVLVGVSRLGKTPLAMYLAMLGWKTANVPFISGQSVPPGLEGIDRGRVIGLTIEAERLVLHRKQRYGRLGMKGQARYTNLKDVFDEAEQALQFFRKKGYAVIDVTDKPLETSADEVVEIITSRFGLKQDEAIGCSDS
ncbi:MAG: kinase/pyrophosphorylase [Deltaproteobacteria bacterium]|nr:kinase/pyrophosphorylase [Deltaproteobacteria bacterium]